MQVMTKNKQKTDIGLIGLAVMGENLALNMADKGWHVSVYNRTVPGVEEGVVERFTVPRERLLKDILKYPTLWSPFLHRAKS